MTFAIGALILVLLIMLAIPIGFGLALAGIGSLTMLMPFENISSLISPVIHRTTANSILLPIPMFVLMAEFLAAGGVAQDLLLACNRLMHRIRGGMAMACILAGTIHAAATGSSTASAASLARASFPAMMKAGYAPSFAVGTIAIAGTLAVMIPPSIAFVLYGIMTGTSIGKLFVAGIVPGLLTAVGYLLTISVVLLRRPELGPKRAEGVNPATEAATASSNGQVWPMVVLIVVIIGGLYTGIATPTEISAIGALGALLISLYCGRMSWHGFFDAIGGTMRITSMIILIMIGAHIFGYFISVSRFTSEILALINQSGWAPTTVMLTVVLVYLALGTVMDQAAIIILTAPITTELMVQLGYDPVWWGIIMIKTAEIGLVTPPLGIVTFVVSSTTRTNLRSNFVGVLPYVVTEMILLAILLAFPQISLFLTQ
ncbi:TRAP transporter large permease [Paracoccus sp. (in: a-proteobacteria)]|uniref:TRAP transporter large permease n=1 Tax=Paracoccus sp. TaxID=267 RepID=UPI002AFFFE6D|nr:TRAP transporter large permease [Paracoccus sp. (in: a-proteobacteria)]